MSHTPEPAVYPQPDDAAPELRTSAISGTSIALVATFAAVIVVCSLIPAIPVSALPVPITLQTFGVLLAGAVLGAGRGMLAVLVYLALGFANLPIFAGGSAGFAVLGKPSAGFLLAFPLGAALAGWLIYRLIRKMPVEAAVAVGALAGTLLIHAVGVPVMAWRLNLSLGEAIVADAVFLPGDLIKVALIVIVAGAVHRAFPDLARR